VRQQNETIFCRSQWCDRFINESRQELVSLALCRVLVAATEARKLFSRRSSRGGLARRVMVPLPAVQAMQL